MDEAGLITLICAAPKRHSQAGQLCFDVELPGMSPAGLLRALEGRTVPSRAPHGQCSWPALQGATAPLGWLHATSIVCGSQKHSVASKFAGLLEMQCQPASITGLAAA